ncbi:CrcB family protein [Kribbella sp. NBC_01245]|uniref:fluoride efflux transporter FluC n=1 Tax=Kribbella sp. NBC_01245 TaxID=2903578 RepID=UPI002E2AD476|nr:CrcB family protein [Kribbella sp. NBC_01245]
MPDPPRLSATLTVIAVGGAVGAVCRYGLAEAIPHSPGAFPWATFATNVLGCLLIGALLAWLHDSRRDRPLLAAFAATGVLGGFTTFSTYAVETRGLLADHPVTAFVYLFGTLAAALIAVFAGGSAVRATRR